MSGQDSGQPPPPPRGAYCIKRRDPGAEGLKGAIFDTYLHNPQATPPAWQRRLHDSIMALAKDVTSSDLSEERKIFYLAGLERILSSACVNLPATQQEPPQAGEIMDYITVVRREFDKDVEHVKREIIRKQFELSQSQVRYFLPAFILLGAIGTVCVKIIPGTAQDIGNYILACAGAVAGMMLFDNMARPANNLEEAVRRERELSHPFHRLLATMIFTVAVCMALISGAIKIELGQWKTAELTTQSDLALFVGFLAGIPTGIIAKKFIPWLFPNG